MLFLNQHRMRFLGVVLGILAIAGVTRTPSAANLVSFEDDFESCDYAKYSDIAYNQIDQTIRHSGKCSSKIGGDGARWGKLAVGFNPGQTDLWFTAWVFFPASFQLPAPGGGIHLWRLMGGHYGTGGVMLDFNIPDRTNFVQLFHFPGDSGGQGVAKNTSFNPIAGDRKGRWQCWEVHARLNQPGKSDGLVEFHADGAFVDSLSGDFRGNSTAPYAVVDVQSNIGGNEELWPTTNWWYIDDVTVSTARIGCLPDTGDKTPPQSPTGLRINAQ